MSLQKRAVSPIFSAQEEAMKNNLARFFFSWFTGFFSDLISPEKTVQLISKVNQQSVLNLYIVNHFPKNLDTSITFNSVTLKNTQTEPQKYIIIFLTK